MLPRLARFTHLFSLKESRDCLHRRHKPPVHLLLPPAQDLVRLPQVLAHRQRPHHLRPPHRPAALWRALPLRPRARVPGEEEAEAGFQQLRGQSYTSHTFNRRKDGPVRKRSTGTYTPLDPFGSTQAEPNSPVKLGKRATTYEAGWDHFFLYPVFFIIIFPVSLLLLLLLHVTQSRNHTTYSAGWIGATNTSMVVRFTTCSTTQANGIWLHDNLTTSTKERILEAKRGNLDKSDQNEIQILNVQPGKDTSHETLLLIS